MIRRNILVILLIIVSLCCCNVREVADNVKEAKDARSKSDSLLREFKKVDQGMDSAMRSLKERHDSAYEIPDSSVTGAIK
ncbi:MAG: hypothetical protein ABIR15_19970 [Chitinophagaceae bacterium]